MLFDVHLFGVAPKSLDTVTVELELEKDRSVIGGMSHDGCTDGGNGLVGRPVGRSFLLAYSSCGKAQTERFDQPQPLYAIQPALGDPKPVEAMEGVAAFAATPSSLLDCTSFSPAATGTKTVSILRSYFDKDLRAIDLWPIN